MDSKTKTKPIAKKGSHNLVKKRPGGRPKSTKNGQRGCQTELIDAADDLDHLNIDETIQNTTGEGNQAQRRENHRQQVPKKTRKTSCDNSRSQKEYGLAIINQIKRAIANSQAQPSQPIKKLLDILNGKHPTKTKFLLLCILIANVPCMYPFGDMLDQIMMNKMNKLLKKNQMRDMRDTTKSEQKIDHLKLFQDLRVKLSRENQGSTLSIFQIQDIMTNQLFNYRQSPLQSTREGLSSIKSNYLEAVDIASVLLEFAVHVDREPFDWQAHQQHIRPNFCGIPVEDVQREDFYYQEQSPYREDFCLQFS